MGQHRGQAAKVKEHSEKRTLEESVERVVAGEPCCGRGYGRSTPHSQAWDIVPVVQHAQRTQRFAPESANPAAWAALACDMKLQSEAEAPYDGLVLANVKM